jgi:hypothetical protein
LNKSDGPASCRVRSNGPEANHRQDLLDRQALLGNGSSGREAEARLEAGDERGLLVDARAVA